MTVKSKLLELRCKEDIMNFKRKAESGQFSSEMYEDLK